MSIDAIFVGSCLGGNHLNKVKKADCEHDLLQNLELLQVSRRNKSIEIRFDSEQTAQHFV